MHARKYGPPISLAEAKQVVDAAETEARANDWAVVIAVTDSAGNLIVLHRMDHAQVGSLTIARAKAETTVRFKRPTKAFEDGLEAGGRELRALSMEGVCALEGGVLLLRNDEIIGGIGISGVHPTQDGQIAAAGAAAIAE